MVVKALDDVEMTLERLVVTAIAVVEANIELEAGIELEAEDGALLVEVAIGNELDCEVVTDADDVRDVDVGETELVAMLDAMVDDTTGMAPL